MNVTYRPFSEVSQFSETDVAYVNCDPKLMQFAKYQPTLSSFEQVLKDKAGDKIDRALLSNVLRDQYETYCTPTDKGLELIKKLENERTFTITTAHQPVLFTGPLYVVYKIISAVKLCTQLQEAYPDHDFIPVFVTGGEDHDFDEMNHAHLFGNELVWENSEKGAVGRMQTESLQPALESLQNILGESDNAKEIYSLFEKTHKHHETYAPAFADLINGLLGPLGILVLNMDDSRLKEKMVSIFRDELFEHHSSKLVRETQSEVEEAGFKPQAYVRDINLFYLDDQIRERIEKEGNEFRVVDTDITFSEDDINELLEQRPDKFSPNVVTRPLFQETILPNLAYIGGGGEIAYWLERKSQFEHFNINFPMLVRRDSCLWVDPALTKRMNKVGLPLEDYFKDEDQQIKDYVSRAAENEFKLGREKGQIMQLFKGIEEKAKAIDPTLRSTIAAEARNQVKSLEKIEDKLRKAEKQRHEIELGQISKIREKLFPGGGLQERYANFLEFYTRHPESYFNTLYDAFDPLNGQLKILS